MVLLETSPKQWELVPNELPGIKVGEFHSLAGYSYRGMPFGIDNGAYSGFDAESFLRKLKRLQPHKNKCLFVAVPDVVGNARRTLECFRHWYPKVCQWPVALCAQNGIEDMEIPWQTIDCIFIGGVDANDGKNDWKLSKAAEDVIRTAAIIGKHIHIGRVNTRCRYDRFTALQESLNVPDERFTCDGSGIARYSWMRQELTSGNQLFKEAVA